MFCVLRQNTIEQRNKARLDIFNANATKKRQIKDGVQNAHDERNITGFYLNQTVSDLLTEIFFSPEDPSELRTISFSSLSLCVGEILMAGVVRLSTTSVQTLGVSSSPFTSFAATLSSPCLPPNLNSDKRLRHLSSSPSCSSPHYSASGLRSHSLLRRPNSKVVRVKVKTFLSF